MNRAVILVSLLIILNVLSTCSSEEVTEEEISHVTDEGPYGGHSVRWYKTHWKSETRDQRKWCAQQSESAKRMQSCIDADTGWKQGWADPKTNPPRRWEDGPSTNK